MSVQEKNYQTAEAPVPAYDQQQGYPPQQQLQHGAPAQVQHQGSYPQMPAQQQDYAAQQGQQQQNSSPYKNAIPLGGLSQTASPIDCPACKGRHMTRTEYQVGNTTWAWALGVCCLTGLGCIPFCISATKNVSHFCTNCNTRVAMWHRSGRTDVLAFS